MLSVTGYDQGGAQQYLGHQMRVDESWALSWPAWERAVIHQLARRFQQNSGPVGDDRPGLALPKAGVGRKVTEKAVEEKHQKRNEVR